MFTITGIQEVIKAVGRGVNVHWQFLGLELGILYPVLETIEQNFYSDTNRCMVEMLITWLEGSSIGSMMVVPSWSTLKTALMNIGEDALAATIPTDGELITTCLFASV